MKVSACGGLLDELGDAKSHYLLEQFIPGDVYHVDAITWDGEVKFALASRYGSPPMTALQGRGVFTTRVLAADFGRGERVTRAE